MENSNVIQSSLYVLLYPSKLWSFHFFFYQRWGSGEGEGGQPIFIYWGGVAERNDVLGVVVTKIHVKCKMHHTSDPFPVNINKSLYA